MIEASKKFLEYFYNLCESNDVLEENFEEIFKNNKSRIEYINNLFNQYNDFSLNSRSVNTFRYTIDYIVSFINGKEKSSNKKIPDEYYNDQYIGAIIPTPDEITFLLKLIESNKEMFEKIYENNPMYLNLPDKSLNQNMTRVLEIKKNNISHLLGLTEYEDFNANNPAKNLLKKHFRTIVEDKSLYKGDTEAEKLLSWLVSKEGKKEIIRINNLTQEFIKQDKIDNPNSYIGDNLKSDSTVVAKFKTRYKNYTGLDYPIINFSRLMVKSINCFNFLRLNNIVEVILDFNAPKGKNNEKDIFLVNRNSKKIADQNSMFMRNWTDLLIDLYKYAYHQDDEKLKKKLLDNGVNVNLAHIKDYLNIVQSYDFMAAYDINPDDSLFDENIIEVLNKNYDRDINLIGFNTEFGNDREIPLDEKVIHNAHCDTSIGLTIAELVGYYYKYGRSFFLDKIESEKGVLMISNVNDEINYLKRVMDFKDSAYHEMLELIELKRVLNENYNNYLFGLERKNR